MFAHIKGHQDDKKKFHQLNRWAQLNVIAYFSAKDRLQQHILQGTDITLSMYLGEWRSYCLGETKCEDMAHQKIKQWIYE